MNRFLFALGFLVALGAAACQTPGGAPVIPATPAPTGPLWQGGTTGLGVQLHFSGASGPNTVATLGRLTLAKIASVRDGFVNWFTPATLVNGSWVYNFGYYDAYVKELNAAGLCTARGPPCIMLASLAGESKYVGTVTPQINGAFIGAFALRYKAQNFVIEDGNECDSENATNEGELPTFGAAGYAAWAIPELTIARTIAPNATILTCSSSSPYASYAAGLTSSGIFSAKAPNGKCLVDGAAVHLYGPLQNAVKMLAEFAAALPKTTCDGRPLLVVMSEYGSPGNADFPAMFAATKGVGFKLYNAYEFASYTCGNDGGWAAVDAHANPNPQAPGFYSALAAANGVSLPSPLPIPSPAPTCP